MASDVLDILVH